MEPRDGPLEIRLSHAILGRWGEPDEDLARPTVSARRHVGRLGRQLRVVLRERRRRRSVPVRRRGREGDPHPRHRADRPGLARLPAGAAARRALRLPRPRPVRPAGGPPFQLGQAPARPLCQGDERRAALGRRPLRLHDRSRRGRPGARRPRQRAGLAQVRRDRSRLHVGRGRAPAHPLGRSASRPSSSCRCTSTSASAWSSIAV